MTMSKDRIRRMKLQHQAEGYLELGMSQQALDVLSRLGDSGDADLHTLYLQGEALRGLGRYAEALGTLGRVTKAEPENVHAWLALGWCHKRTGRIDLAIDALEAARSADPEEPLIHYNLACYWTPGRRKAAGAGLSGAGAGDGRRVSPLDRRRNGFRCLAIRSRFPGRLRRLADDRLRETKKGQPRRSATAPSASSFLIFLPRPSTAANVCRR